MAIEPSPTLEATRFTEPWRTSPTAKTPGTLVSSRLGSRSSVQLWGDLPSRIRDGPVRMKPCSSRATTPSDRNRKDAGHVGFEQTGVAFERPTLGRLAVANQGRASQDEAVFVARHDAFQPVGAGLRASEYKQRAGVHAFARVGPPAFDGDGFQVVLTVHLRHLRLIFDLYIRGAGDLVDQVLRHGRGQRLAAHQHHHPPRIA